METLAPGEVVDIVLPNGEVVPGAATSDGSGFSFTADLLLAETFGVSGTVSAYVVSAQQVKGTAVTQGYGADSQRTISLVTATPDDLTASGLGQVALSGDGRSVAFDAFPTGDEDSGSAIPPVQAGLYLENLQTQAVTLVVANGSQASVSYDGQEIAYAVSDEVGVQVHVKSFVTGLDLLISATAGSEGTARANGVSDRPSLAANGQTVAFESSATDLLLNGSSQNQIFVAQGLSDVASVSLVSASEAGGEGDGDSLSPSLSADGSTVAFASTADNLLGAGSPYDGSFTGNYQIYVKTLTGNAVTGLSAGAVTLVTGLAGGIVADGESLYPSVSGDGRYVVFQSSADDLAPGIAVPSEANEIYLKDLLTGAITLVGCRRKAISTPATAISSRMPIGSRRCIRNSGRPETGATPAPGSSPTDPSCCGRAGSSSAGCAGLAIAGCKRA